MELWRPQRLREAGLVTCHPRGDLPGPGSETLGGPARTPLDSARAFNGDPAGDSSPARPAPLSTNERLTDSSALPDHNSQTVNDCSSTPLPDLHNSTQQLSCALGVQRAFLSPRCPAPPPQHAGENPRSVVSGFPPEQRFFFYRCFPPFFLSNHRVGWQRCYSMVVSVVCGDVGGCGEGGCGCCGWRCGGDGVVVEMRLWRR